MDDIVILVTGAVIGIVVFNLFMFGINKKDK